MCIRTYRYTYMHIYIHLYMQTHLHRDTCVTYMHTHIHTSIHSFIYVSLTCTSYIHTQTYIYIYIITIFLPYTYTYTDACTNTLVNITSLIHVHILHTRAQNNIFALSIHAHPNMDSCSITKKEHITMGWTFAKYICVCTYVGLTFASEHTENGGKYAHTHLHEPTFIKTLFVYALTKKFILWISEKLATIDASLLKGYTFNKLTAICVIFIPTLQSLGTQQHPQLKLFTLF